MFVCSLQEELVPDGLKKSCSHSTYKKASLPVEDLKSYRLVAGGMCSC